MNTSKKLSMVTVTNPAQIPSHFDDPRVFSEDTLPAILLRMCDDIDSPFGDRVRWCINYNAWDSLLDMDVHPSAYVDHLSYFKDAQLFALVKKYPLWQTSHDPEQKAKEIFVACEAQCRDTNHRFWSHEHGSWAVNSVLAVAQRNISNILGECPDVTELPFRFGPGASYSVKYNTSALSKLASSVDATPACYAISEKFLESCPGWRPNKSFDIEGPIRPLGLNLVKGDRLTFVPKTAKTHRPIGVNPLLNGVIQKGYGAVIRSKLRPYIDLNKLQPIHRTLARAASKSGYLATIDLQSASDTIAYALVQSLLPDDWFQALNSVRSPCYTVEDNWYPYQKFSAMGNGFTFELETLIFYSLCSAVCEHLKEEKCDVSVYGDDIVIPATCTPLLKEVLTFCGFSVNKEKSFTDGPFRESCGGDYFDGFDVRPFQLKGAVTYRTLFLYHNFLERSGWRFLFKKTFGFIRRLIGKRTFSHFRTWNRDDDFALLDCSCPVVTYNSIRAFEVGKRHNVEVRTYGACYGLYRISLRETPSDHDDVPWYKMRRYRIKYSPYRHVLI